MNWQILINSKLIENLGWTLLHSVWQIALLALILFLLLRVLQKFSANARYLVSVFALALALVLPIVTFVGLNENSSSNFFRPENPSEPDAARFDPNFQPEKNLPLPAKAETTQTNANGKNVFDSIENLQNFFNKSFSDVLPFVVGLWFFGAAFFALRLTGGVWQLHLYKTREISAPAGEWQERFAALCEKLKIRPSVKFLQSNLIQTPIVVGWLKPVILVPASVFLQISAKELETVIAHELVHIRRRDALVNFAQSIIEALFFYHPCVWWMSSVLRREREFATDEAVIKILENSHIIYASALANLEEIRLLTNQKLPPFSTAAVKGGNLMQRITKILQKNTETHAKANSAWSAGLALVLISAFFLAVFSFNQPAFVNAQTKTKNRKLAIGFVSLPPLDRTANAPKDADATARLLIETLKGRKIPAIGFVHGAVISDGEKFYPVRANIVRLWRDAGFEIGIGNYNHVWFYNTPYEEYVAGVEKNERVVRKLLAEKNLPLRYFSYPFLNTGKTAEERNRFESWLNGRGLSPVKYTIDNQEWMYSYAYDMARNDNDINTMREIREAFAGYMTKMFDHYEAYSQEIFGRDINQTMVLTPSRLVTDSANELFGMIEKRGYQFVSMEEALTDEAYKTEESFYGKAGISWFERWQMAKGKKLLDEPEVDAGVQKIWNENKAKK
ncbi:MAG TPA: M56 family metallopeptidase [Pyrinomonadaceae bacterium]|jgi:beta-lactamase regulating signal transducer with metallopeptidase domain/peptidoglycan/xylan/chitin deacetylase (PgdA/CDA1 family)